MMIVSFSPSTHLVDLSVWGTYPSPHIKTVLYCACNFAHRAHFVHFAQVCPDDLCVCAGCKFQVSTLTLSRVCPYPLSLVVIRMFHTTLRYADVSFLFFVQVVRLASPSSLLPAEPFSKGLVLYVCFAHLAQRC